MKVSVHVVLQVLALIIQYGNLATNIVPAKVQPVVTLVVSAAQGALAWYNHWYTPAGIKISS